MPKKSKDWILVLIKLLLLFSLVLALPLLFFPLIELLKQNSLSEEVLRFVQVVFSWPIAIFLLVLVFKEELVALLRVIVREIIRFSLYLEKLRNKNKFIRENKEAILKIEQNDDFGVAKKTIDYLLDMLEKKNRFLFFERTYHYVFGDQVKLLAALTVEPLQIKEIDFYYQQIKNSKEFKEIDEWDLKTYLDFLTESSLIQKDQKGLYAITNVGKEYIKYLELRNYISNERYFSNTSNSNTKKSQS